MNEFMKYWICGGSWHLYGYTCRSAYRLNCSPRSRFGSNGFRVVRGGGK